MRIRKRQMLFPSTLSTVSLSDPHLINRSPDMVQLRDATTTTHHASAPAQASSLDRYQPSDQPLPPIGKPTNGCDDPSGIGGRGTHGQHKKQEPLDEDNRRQESGDSGEKVNNSHARKGRIFGSEVPTQVFPPSRTSSTQDGRWCEGEKAIPLKKRRGSFENGTENNSKKMRARMKTKMNKKCSTQQQNDGMEVEEEEEEDGEEVEGRETKPDVNVGKKRARARGSALMEGSRCSRVNGRGWRCCQQTLVGYSLCEHHLGKGRLRSMTSVRSRSIASTTTLPEKVHDLSDPLSGASPSRPEKQTNCVTDDPLGSDEKKPVTITKKRMKLGMVKARSISSLLGQTNTNEIAAAHENNNQ